MKKNAVLFSVLAIFFVAGLMACSSSSKYTPPPPPVRQVQFIIGSWRLDSVVFSKNQSITDSASYGISAVPDYNNSSIGFGLYNTNILLFGFNDKKNASLPGPRTSAISSGDTTIFRYMPQNLIVFSSVVPVNSLPPSYDSLIGFNGNTGQLLFRWKIASNDSTTMKITYMDSSIFKNNNKLYINKQVYFKRVATTN